MKSNFSFLNKAKTVAVVCNQWGDTGKGKIVDFLTPWADIVARGTGGANAGHTVEWEGKHFVTHLLPSSIFHDKEGKISIIGSGVAFDPHQCIRELTALQGSGYSSNHLLISRRAKLVLPHHILLDRISQSRSPKDAIGTTGRGIGPTYADYYSRTALFVGDLFHKETFAKKLIRNSEPHLAHLKNFDREAIRDVLSAICKEWDIFFDQEHVLDLPAIVERYASAYASKLKSYVVDTDEFLRSVHGKKNILLEGAQGYLLSIDYGSYPYVTSSDCSIEGLAKGVGLSVRDVDLTLGAVKAFYMTRVGKGPFPTEFGGVHGEEHCATHTKDQELQSYPQGTINDPNPFLQGIAIRKEGGEYGATTGRLRRVGWLDLPLLRQALRINGDDIILTKLDVLDLCEEIKICTAYRYRGESYFLGRDTIKEGAVLKTAFPESSFLKLCEPIYQTFPGWMSVTSQIRAYHDLPLPMRTIIEFIEQETGAHVRMISVGPDRAQTIVR